MSDPTLAETAAQAPAKVSPSLSQGACAGAAGSVPAPTPAAPLRNGVVEGAGPTGEIMSAVEEAQVGCRADPFGATLGAPRRVRFRLNSAYGLSAFVGVVTYLAYGSLNQAWSNWVLVAVGLYMFLSIPLYSKLSNKIEVAVTERTNLETGGRIARYIPQLLINLALLWVFVEGQVIELSGLDGIGGFFATAAWITIVSQGGQYLANWLALKKIGDADQNVVLAVSISAIVNALAVSGVTWIHPIYIGLSLSFGAVIFGVGLVADTKFLTKRA